MTSDLRIEKLTRQGIALMQEERDVALKGEFAKLADLNARKTEFLTQIEALLKRAASAGPKAMRDARRQELETLLDIMRRRAAENQALLRAAESGIKSAKRQIAEIAAASERIGAYNKDGQPVNTSNSARSNDQLF